MDWIHCNSCFTQPGDIRERTFIITNCGHIFCKDCLIRGPNNTTGCNVCKKICTTCDITGSNLHGEIKQYFTSVRSMVEKCLKVVKFQNDHRQRMIVHYRSLVKKYNEIKMICKDTYDKMHQLQQRISNLENENNSLRQAYNTSLDFQFPRNSVSPKHASKPRPFVHAASPYFQGTQKHTTPNTYMLNVYGTPSTITSTTPAKIIGGRCNDERTPDYVQQLRKISFNYSPASED